MHNFEVLQLPFHLGCLDRLQVQHEEKSFIAGASSMMAVLASIWGAFFSVTFKLPFHALPLLSPHPASFRSFTPWASSFFQQLYKMDIFLGNWTSKKGPFCAVGRPQHRPHALLGEVPRARGGARYRGAAQPGPQSLPADEPKHCGHLVGRWMVSLVIILTVASNILENEKVLEKS